MAATVDVNLDATFSVTTDELNEFLRERDAEKPCDACGHTVEWFMRAAPNGKPVISFTGVYSDPSKAELHFSLFCPNCGHVRLFYAPYVANVIVDMRRRNNG